MEQDTLEKYLAGLTGKQMRGAALKFWAQAGGKESGAKTLDMWRAGHLKIQLVETIPRLPLVGRVVKTIAIPPYTASNFSEAIRLGEFDNGTTDIVSQFAEEQVGLTKHTKVELVAFDRDWWNDEVLVWGTENGRKPIVTAHTIGIATKLRGEQRGQPIAALGSERQGSVLYLRGNAGWPSLRCRTVEGRWDRDYLVGFISE